MRLLVVISMIYLLLSAFTPFTPASTGHGCAPLDPPAVGAPLAQPSARTNILFINEVLPAPSSLWNCAGQPPPRNLPDTWVEIYNPQDQAFDLFTTRIVTIDTGPNTTQFFFPHDSAIAAHGYLVVFPHTDLHFTSTVTPTLRLLISGFVVDQVNNIPPLSGDTSYARIPDGSPNWQPANPTIDASNTVLPTPIATSRQRSTSNGNGATTNKGSHNTADTTSIGSSQDTQGVQPTWSTMQFPTGATPSAVTDEAGSLTSTNPPTANTASIDIPRMIVIILLVIALMLALLWCWRLLLSKKTD